MKFTRLATMILTLAIFAVPLAATQVNGGSPQVKIQYHRHARLAQRHDDHRRKATARARTRSSAA